MNIRQSLIDTMNCIWLKPDGSASCWLLRTLSFNETYKKNKFIKQDSTFVRKYTIEVGSKINAPTQQCSMLTASEYPLLRGLYSYGGINDPQHKHITTTSQHRKHITPTSQPYHNHIALTPQPHHNHFTSSPQPRQSHIVWGQNSNSQIFL